MKELELSITKCDKSAYEVGIRLDIDDGGIQVIRDKNRKSVFHLDELEKAVSTLDMVEYGQRLSKLVFRSDAISSQVIKILDHTGLNNEQLRIRLLIGPNAQELHRIQWECLCSPLDGYPICTNERIVFSRYMSSLGWRPISIRNQDDLKTCFIAPDPANIGSYQIAKQVLHTPNHEEVLASIKNAVPDQTFSYLSGGGSATFVSLKKLAHKGVDIVVLLCHGNQVGGETVLFMEDKKGNTKRCHAIDLIAMISSLKTPPALVVLMSCDSFGKGYNFTDTSQDPLTSLAPRLVEAGVPAVLAMQGKISVSTATGFLSEVFNKLAIDGCIDRSVSAARFLVSEEHDWYIPTLFTRLRDGRVWHRYGFDSNGKSSADLWLTMSENIEDRKCTPIVGSGVTEFLVGSRSELSRNWAAHYAYPLAPYMAEQFPHVAQYVKTNFGESFLSRQLEKYCKLQLKERHAKLLKNSDVGDFESAVKKIVSSWLQRTELDAISTLSRLPFPIYITTGFTEALEHCLRLRGMDPVTEYCRWNEELLLEPDNIEAQGKSYEPTATRPLVYHLFGIQRVPESLVLSEDDYFDFLIGISQNRDKIPKVVLKSLTNSSLLIMGYVLDDWEFRAMFQLAQAFRRRQGYEHVAAQIDPEDGRVIKPEKARKYLEKYLGKANVNIFWGSSSHLARQMSGNENIARLLKDGIKDD